MDESGENAGESDEGLIETDGHRVGINEGIGLGSKEKASGASVRESIDGLSETDGAVEGIELGLQVGLVDDFVTNILHLLINMPFSFGAPKDIQTFRITLKRDNNEWITEKRWLMYDELRDFLKEINKKLKKYLDSQKIEYDTNNLTDRLIEVDNTRTDYMISRTCKRLKYSFYVGKTFGRNEILETVELTGQELFKKLTKITLSLSVV